MENMNDNDSQNSFDENSENNYLLQEKHKTNKFLIGISAILTPLARLVVNFNVWIR
jgi:hypothetical protein